MTKVTGTLIQVFIVTLSFYLFSCATVTVNVYFPAEEVVQAYRNRGKRLDVINNMLSQGKVGIGNKGLLVLRGDLTNEEKADFNAENKDRETIIEGMATAIVKINGIDPTPKNIKKVIPEAAEQFAAVRRNEAQPGWWIQLPDGRWALK